ncbi:hypothetical protein KBC25_01385 [Candidatus Pacearchaeota archaeon]|nr:hypothetical protein [Candidatus Pacearchaeota archaeon]HNZ52030.1 hypothetical protein [Candidatus Pacearchaeota archaeon]HOC96775.1 hypothetical protein [Candidatus Pacearchaeota archaeon]HOF44121.1 hypothetical protein [Candidatus Pacearchaeota archaeon]HOH04112.1 hypothetical protein [Candidatus Pacearchaeota archaeon]
MNTKKILVSLCTIAMVLFLVTIASAEVCRCEPTTNVDCECCGTLITTPSDAPLAGCVTIEVDGMNINNNPSVIAGEDVTVKVTFTSIATTTGVRIKAELEGDKDSVEAMTGSFDVEAGHTYTKSLRLKVPFELKDVTSDDLELSVRIWNSDYESEYENIALRVQRPSYNPVVKSISVAQSVNAGKTIPVDILVKNMGYNDLEDLYVTVGIPTLGVKKTAYFGDLVTKESCTKDCKEEDTVSGRIYLEIPYGVEAGIYNLEVLVENDDVESTFVRQIAIENNLPKNVIVTSNKKTVAVGQEAEYSLLLVNPTDSLLVYTIVAESNGEVSSSVDSAVVAVPAGSSKTVTVTAMAKSEGEYNFDVNVFSNNKVVEKVTLNLKAEGRAVNPIVVLTVVLAIIFLVLLVVLIVLLGRKPQKTEEFGESYY